jgi:hypothetical protein
MADAGLVSVRTAKLLREIDERECKTRNALSRTKPGFRLKHGDTVKVVESFSGNQAFLVEAGASKKDSCDWMGVLYPSELEMGA